MCANLSSSSSFVKEPGLLWLWCQQKVNKGKETDCGPFTVHTTIFLIKNLCGPRMDTCELVWPSEKA